MDQRATGGQKRPRGDGLHGEGDWLCPKCGNVNFSFRSTCNLRKCGAPKPAPASQRTGPPFVQIHDHVPTALYMGAGTGAPPSLPLGLTSNYGVSLGISSAAGMGYGSGHGFGYSAVDGPYGMNLATTRTQMMAAGRPGFMTEESGARKRRGDAKSEGDWICPKCGNTNYSFRVVCNMKKCNTPKPAAPVSQIHGIPSSADTTPPDGSWTCDQCGNVNYPFRTKCNRRSCGAEKPSNKREPSGSPSTSE